jgi:hypothetical protein
MRMDSIVAERYRIIIWYNLTIIKMWGMVYIKNLYRFLIGFHVFVGVGAIFGGLVGILNPLGPLGMSVEVLKNSPFSSFLIPSIILLLVVGLGNIAAAAMVYYKSKLHGCISGLFNGALVIWIVIQCIMLRTVAALHVIYFIIGLIGATMSAVVLFKQHQFPANIIIDFYKKINKEA